jgi:hypothetical protein
VGQAKRNGGGGKGVRFFLTTELEFSIFKIATKLFLGGVFHLEKIALDK